MSRQMPGKLLKRPAAAGPVQFERQAMLAGPFKDFLRRDSLARLRMVEAGEGLDADAGLSFERNNGLEMGVEIPVQQGTFHDVAHAPWRRWNWNIQTAHDFTLVCENEGFLKKAPASSFPSHGRRMRRSRLAKRFRLLRTLGFYGAESNGLGRIREFSTSRECRLQ